MNFGLVRKERIVKLENKIQRVTNALVTYPYTNAKDYLDDLAALENFEKELQIQQSYVLIESNLQ